MRLLLDTSIYLWWLADSRKLSKATRDRIEAADEVYVSAASIVECEAKIAVGLLEADTEELVRAIRASGFRELPVRVRPAALAARSNASRVRIFRPTASVAQAVSEPLRFVTTNAALTRYSELVEVV
jgi:PIN domain nuclease of toxin-antitoxin system